MSKYNKNQSPENAPSMVEEAAALYSPPLLKVLQAREGVSASFVQDLLHKYSFNKPELAQLIGVSPKTLDRHLQAKRIFTGLQAERLLHLAQLYQRGIEVFGSSEKFLKWISNPIAVLKNTTPRSWFDTQQGIDLILDELGRIQHGIFA